MNVLMMGLRQHGLLMLLDGMRVGCVCVQCRLCRAATIS